MLEGDQNQAIDNILRVAALWDLTEMRDLAESAVVDLLGGAISSEQAIGWIDTASRYSLGRLKMLGLRALCRSQHTQDGGLEADEQFQCLQPELQAEVRCWLGRSLLCS